MILFSDHDIYVKENSENMKTGIVDRITISIAVRIFHEYYTDLKLPCWCAM